MSKIKEAIEAWKRGAKFNRLKGVSVTTDGDNLYSYDLAIGITGGDGSKILLDYTAPAGAFVSQTTSTHVGIAKSVADQVMRVEAAELADLLPIHIPF